MFEVGFSEILLILGLALLVLGPEKLPGLAEKLGRWTGRARAMARQLRTQLEQEVNLEEMARSQPMQAPPPAADATPPPTAANPAPAAPADMAQAHTSAPNDETTTSAHNSAGGPGLDLDTMVSGLGPHRTPTDTTKPAP